MLRQPPIQSPVPGRIKSVSHTGGIAPYPGRPMLSASTFNWHRGPIRRPICLPGCPATGSPGTTWIGMNGVSSQQYRCDPTPGANNPTKGPCRLGDWETVRQVTQLADMSREGFSRRFSRLRPGRHLGSQQAHLLAEVLAERVRSHSVHDGVEGVCGLGADPVVFLQWLPAIDGIATGLVEAAL